MKKIIMHVTEDIKEVFETLQELSSLLNIPWDMTIVDDYFIKIIYDDGCDKTKRYLVVDIDAHHSINLEKFAGYIVITAGFNKKASITVSSVEDGEIVFCIQRQIALVNEVFEPQEFVFTAKFFQERKDMHAILAFTTLLLIKGKAISETKKYF